MHAYMRKTCVLRIDYECCILAHFYTLFIKNNKKVGLSMLHFLSNIKL